MHLTDKQRDDLQKAQNFYDSVAIQAVQIRDEIRAVLDGTKDVPELQTDEVLSDARKRDDAFPSLVDFSEDPDVL